MAKTQHRHHRGDGRFEKCLALVGLFLLKLVIVVSVTGAIVDIGSTSMSSSSSSSLVTSFLNSGPGEAGDDERWGMICGKTHKTTFSTSLVYTPLLVELQSTEPGSVNPLPSPERATLDSMVGESNVTSTEPSIRITLATVVNIESTKPGSYSVGEGVLHAKTSLEVLGATTLRVVFESPLSDGDSFEVFDASLFEMKYSLENLDSVDSVYVYRSTADGDGLRTSNAVGDANIEASTVRDDGSYISGTFTIAFRKCCFRVTNGFVSAFS
jgi:hypothetical protein